MNAALLLLNNSRKEKDKKSINNIFIKKILKNKILHNMNNKNSNSFMKSKKKINMYNNNKINPYKRYKSSNNSISTYYRKDKKKLFNKINNNYKQILTSSRKKKSKNKNWDKTKIKLKNYFLKNNLMLKERHSINFINLKNLKNYGNIKNSENLNKYSSFYNKLNKKSNKKYEIKINQVNKNIFNNSYDKFFDSTFIKKNKSHSKNKIGNNKKYQNNLSKNNIKEMKINKKILYNNKINNIYAKTNQGNCTSTRRNNSCLNNNIFLNNNYSNYINFNYIDKNYNINNINIRNNKILHKNSSKSNKYISSRKDNHEFLDLIQSKLRTNHINTFQSRDKEISFTDLKKLNSYINLLPNNSLFNSLSPEFKKKKIFETKKKQNKISSHTSQISKYIINKNIFHENKKISNQRNKNKSPNKIKNDSNENNINNTSTTQDYSYYKSLRDNLSKNIKTFFQNKGHYPKSSLEFYKIGRIIGKGAFGKVNLALHIASGRLVAIKSFNKKKLTTERSKLKINNEIEILKKIKKINFCTKIYDTFETEDYILIVMEYICGDLLNYIRKREKLKEKIAKNIFKQILTGLKYIHKLNIVHRDIKLDNLLLDLNNTIKICDFGVSKILSSAEDIMYDHCGTPAYIPPEIFQNLGYKGFSCDIWSLGVTLYYMLGGEQPFKGKNLTEIKENIFEKNYKKIDNVSDEANDLIDKMLIINPENRITLDEIFNHEWIKNININERKDIKFFTKAEKNFLKKFNICYLNKNIFNHINNNLIENFTNKNIVTVENEEKKGNTKSVILAPYNTYITYYDEDDSLETKEAYKELKIENEICKFKPEAKLSNIKYELSNNDEFDNGVIKTLNDEDTFSNMNSKDLIYTNNNLSFDDKNIFDGNYSWDIINKIEINIGYDKNYLIQCLKNDEINYATATYYLMIKNKNNDTNSYNNEDYNDFDFL